MTSTPRTLALILAVLAAAAPPAFSQEPPTIEISKSDRIDIALGAISGPDGEAVASVLRNDLELSGWFKIAPAGKAALSAGGSSSGGGLNGVVTDAAGRTVLSESYSGSARERAHRFADAIVETITGKKGMASSKIAFVATRSGKKEIYTADYDGKGVSQITRDNSISVSPALSPDGSRLAYTGYQSGYADIYEINLRSGARERIVKFPGTNSGAAYSPDGRRIACSVSKDGNPELYVGSRRLTKTRGVESSPTWSPDGGEIIYSSDDRGTPQLYRISANGGSGRPLSTGHSYCTEPNWSPDGSKVAFSVRGGGGFLVAVLDLSSGQTRTLGAGEDPVWGPNSRHILFSHGGSLHMLDSVTGSRTRILGDLGKITEPTWSR